MAIVPAGAGAGTIWNAELKVTASPSEGMKSLTIANSVPTKTGVVVVVLTLSPSAVVMQLSVSTPSRISPPKKEEHWPSKPRARPPVAQNNHNLGEMGFGENSPLRWLAALPI
ncbi:MAG: hypothetical protein AAGI53_16380 [Planctomycetota bacterium]